MWSYFSVWKHGEIDIPGFIQTVKDNGAEGVELLDFFWKDRDAELPAVLQALSTNDIPVGVYSVSNNFVTTDESLREKNLNAIKAGVDNANEFGAKVVRVFAGNQDDNFTFHQAFGLIVDGLKAASEYAEERNVVLALENHGKLAGKSDQIRAIIEAVGSKSLRANPDTGNFLLVHQTPHEAVKEIAPLAAMVHFKDFHEVPETHEGFAYISLDGLKYVGTALGDGDVALAECVSELRSAGFHGWLNIEYEGEEDPRKAVPRSIGYTKALLGK